MTQLELADNAQHTSYFLRTPRLIGGDVAAVVRREVPIDLEPTTAAEHRPVSATGEGLAPRPIGGWSFVFPDGWDTPLEDFSE